MTSHIGTLFSQHYNLQTVEACIKSHRSSETLLLQTTGNFVHNESTQITYIQVIIEKQLQINGNCAPLKVGIVENGGTKEERYQQRKANACGQIQKSGDLRVDVSDAAAKIHGGLKSCLEQDAVADSGVVCVMVNTEYINALITPSC